MLAALAGAVLLGACAQTPAHPDAASASGAESFGVRALASPPSRVVETPSTDAVGAALGGAEQQAWRAVEGGARMDRLVGQPNAIGAYTLLGLALSPIYGLAGAIERGHAPPDPTAVERARAVIDQILAETRPAAALRDRLVAATDGHPGWHVRALLGNERAPAVDRVLEIRVVRLALVRHRRLGPDRALVIDARARLLRTADGAVLWTRDWHDVSPQHDYGAWAGNDAEILRAEIDAGIAALARRMAGTLAAAAAGDGG